MDKRVILCLGGELARSLQEAARKDRIPLSIFCEELLARSLNNRSGRGDAIRRWNTLSLRQRQVAALVRQNLTYPEIGERLVLSPHTVRMHVRRILERFEVRNKNQLQEMLAFLPDAYFSQFDDPDA